MAATPSFVLLSASTVRSNLTSGVLDPCCPRSGRGSIRCNGQTFVGAHRAFQKSALFRSAFGSSGNCKLFSRRRFERWLSTTKLPESEKLNVSRFLECAADDLKIQIENSPASKDSGLAAASLVSLASDQPAEVSTVDLKDPALVRKYNMWRIRVFMGLFFGYIASHFTRSSFTYVAPVLRKEVGVTMEQIGVIASIFPIAYGFSKFFSGVLGDKLSPRHLFAAGLIVTGLLNMAFGFSTSLQWWSLVWGVTGWFAAFGGPVCTRLMTRWFSQSERGTWCGLWNMSHNIGGFLIAIFASWAAANLGWRWGMALPGVVGILIGFYVLHELRESPESMGLPPVDVFRNDRPAPKPVAVPAEGATVAPVVKEADVSMQTILFKYVLSNPYCWLCAISYFFIYFIRSGVTSWSHFYLMDAKGVASAQEAAFRVSGRELGGLLGSLAGGWASDNFCDGRRVPIIVTFIAGIAAAVAALWAIPVGKRYLDWLAIFFIGFFLYGPQMLIGLVGVEMTHRSAVSTASGFLGFISYMGAAVSGHPLTVIVKNYGWSAYFISMLVCCFMSTVLLLPMWNKRSRMDGVED